MFRTPYYKRPAQPVELPTEDLSSLPSKAAAPPGLEFPPGLEPPPGLEKQADQADATCTESAKPDGLVSKALDFEPGLPAKIEAGDTSKLAKADEDVAALDEVSPKIASWNLDPIANVHPYLCHEMPEAPSMGAGLQSAKHVGVQSSYSANFQQQGTSRTKLSAKASPFVGFTTYIDGGAPFGMGDFADDGGAPFGMGDFADDGGAPFGIADFNAANVAFNLEPTVPTPFTKENDEPLNVPLLGSMAVVHDSGECKPCAYFLLKEDGCRWGMECEFCHLCPADELKKRKKEKIKAMKQEQQEDGTKGKNPIWFVRRRQLKKDKAKSEAP